MTTCWLMPDAAPVSKSPVRGVLSDSLARYGRFEYYNHFVLLHHFSIRSNPPEYYPRQTE